MNYDRIRALGPWLAEANHVWFGIISSVIALAIALRPNNSEPVIRLTGLGLQVFGIGTVVWGIAETRKFFAHTPIMKAVKAWLGSFPLRKRHIIFGAAAGEVSTLFGHGRAHVSYGPGSDPTIETRLNAIEKNIDAIHDRITATQRELDERLQKANDGLASEAAARKAEVERTKKMIETSATGGVHITAIGAAWLFIGVVLSTAAPELSTWLKTSNSSSHRTLSTGLPHPSRAINSKYK